MWTDSSSISHGKQEYSSNLDYSYYFVGITRKPCGTLLC